MVKFFSEKVAIKTKSYKTLKFVFFFLEHTVLAKSKDNIERSMKERNSNPRQFQKTKAF